MNAEALPREVLPGKEIIPLENIEVRPTVYWYAKRLENRLRLKDKSHKHGWLDGNLRYYIVRIFECWKEAVQPLQYESSKLLAVQQRKGMKYPTDITQKDVELAIKKCVDGGNFFMMLADNLRNILLERGLTDGKK